jgi:KTSC domain
MQRNPVSSSAISSVGYDDSSSTMEVRFQGGGVYQYYQVPEPVYQRLMSALSKGSYHARHIKSRYRCRRVA